MDDGTWLSCMNPPYRRKLHCNQPSDNAAIITERRTQAALATLDGSRPVVRKSVLKLHDKVTGE